MQKYGKFPLLASAYFLFYKTKENILEFLYEYGLFLAKALTVVISFGLIVGIAITAAAKNRPSKGGVLELDNISDQIEAEIKDLKCSMMSKSEIKEFEKQQKNEQKLKQKKEKENLKNQLSITKPKMFIIEFNGSMDAKEVESLRKEISAVISIAKPEDKVLIKLESPGGVVHGYGLAASQIARLRSAKIETIAAVDKVAASGGYMMACVADKIIAAPFAIIGSIGVVAQLPNINKLLKKNNVDIEQHTAGNFKRTLTVLGENTDEGREKFKQELNETHELFKTFVTDYRPNLDIESVATGEHWYGSQALENHLVDEIKTSDDFILESVKDNELYKVHYKMKQGMAEKLGIATANIAQHLFNKIQIASFLSYK